MNSVKKNSVKVSDIVYYQDKYEKFDVSSLPAKVTSIIFSEGFNEQVYNFTKSARGPSWTLSDSVTSITFGPCFNRPVDKLPNSVKTLIFGRYFNRTVDKLPNSLTSIELGHDFDKSVDKLPNSVTSITFGYQFNQYVDNLPKSVTSITFGREFNRPVDNLPNSVTSIAFGFCFVQSLQKLPKFVKTVCFNDVRKEYIYNNINVYITKFIHEGKNKNLNNIFSLKYYITSFKIANSHDNIKKRNLNNVFSLKYYIKKLPYGCTQKIEY